MASTALAPDPVNLNHRANVILVGPVLIHPNADNLEITFVGGFQCVIGKGSLKEGDLAVYIQPDSIVPQTTPFEFIWKDHIGLDGVVPEKRRRITVRRFRKEYSEGLLLPLSDFPDLVAAATSFSSGYVGQDVSDVIGVTHYVPEADIESTTALSTHAPKRRYPRSLRGWFFWALHKIGLRQHKDLSIELAYNFPIYDLNNLKNHKDGWLREGELVSISEKIHGSNARFVFIDGVFYGGSHRQWKQKGSGVWWKVVEQHPEIEEWCTQHPGLVLYGEVGPTQKGYRYGCDEDESFFFAFDVWNPETKKWSWPGNEGFAPTVPVLWVGPYDKKVVRSYVDGRSVVPGADGQIREGIVVSTLSRSCKSKLVSNAFLEKDSK